MKIGAARIATLWILFLPVSKVSLHGDEVGSVVRVDKGVGANPLPRLEQVSLGEGVALEMVLVPPGNFKMGAGQLQSGTDKKVRDVRITKPFHIGKFEVTQAQWQAVVTTNPGNPRKPSQPVNFVSWDDCQDFVRKLNERTTGGFRLPTEAEWEYACRGGTDTSFAFGETLTKRDANFGHGDEGKPEPVGRYPANAFGLHDMHGNVWEWCQDWTGDLPEGPLKDPKGSQAGKERILRGGCFTTGQKAGSAPASAMNSSRNTAPSTLVSAC